MARTLTGIVVSNKADKTIIVNVETRKTHPIYKKQYTEGRRIAAHDESNEANVGDKVTIIETRPISASKRFKLQSIDAKAGIAHIENELEILSADSRGMQPDEAIDSLPGALLGDTPPSKGEVKRSRKS